MIGSTCAHFYSTCQEAADASAIPFETSSQVLRFPGDPSRTVDALCFVHDDRIYTNIACDDLNPGGCTSVYRSTEQDTCKVRWNTIASCVAAPSLAKTLFTHDCAAAVGPPKFNSTPSKGHFVFLGDWLHVFFE
eukprot:m.380492 g.380492  ORF g.380492 m.380492 type:complete len:134 (-) comp20036_c0_seq4:699-1100(-)